MSEQDATGAEDLPVPEQPVGDTPAEPPTNLDLDADLDEGNDDGPVVIDDLGGQSFSDAVDATIVEFDDGDIVKGTVVKIDSDEVLLDIGYKSEGVIPSR